MTTTLPAVTLAEYDDDTLARWYGDASDDATAWRGMLEAEMARRDAAGTAHGAYEVRGVPEAAGDGHLVQAGSARTSREPCRLEQRAEWERMAHAQWLDAERVTRGELLNARGIREHVDPWSLWSGPAHRVELYASEELRNYWLSSPRIDISTYQRQAAGERRAWIDRHDREAPSDRVDAHAAGAVRPVASERQDARVRQDGRGNDVPGLAARGGAQDSQAGGSAARPGGTIRGGRVSETLPTTPNREYIRQRAAEIRRIAAQGSPGDTVAGEQEPSGVIAPGEPERPSTDLVAVREGTVVYDSDPPEPIDGAELLGHLAGYFGTYVAFPSVASHVTVSLWNAAATARDRDDSGIGPLIWRALALLGLTSSDNKSGKSTVLDLSGMVLGVQRPVKITGRSLAHKLGRKHEAVLLDEVKVTFGAGAASREVQSVMLAAYSQRGTWDYSRGNADVSIPCHGPLAYAAKDDLITATGGQLIDIFDRTIFCRMKRPKALMPQPDEQAEDDGRMLGESLIEWTSSVKGALKARARELARIDYEASQEAAEAGIEIDARRPQIWRPLLAVADVAGGPWPVLARQAMRELTDGAAKTEAVGKMADLRKMSQRWAPVAFLNGTAPQVPADDDYDYDEDEL